MLEKAKSWALAALAVLTWVLFGWVWVVKERLDETQTELALEKAKEGVADAIAKQEESRRKSADSLAEFDSVVADYRDRKGGGA